MGRLSFGIIHLWPPRSLSAHIIFWPVFLILLCFSVSSASDCQLNSEQMIHAKPLCKPWEIANHTKIIIVISMKVAQLCLTPCDPMGCRLPGSSVHRILQARILEWVAVPFSRGSSWPRSQTGISSIVDGFFTIWATREAGDKNDTLYGFILFICFHLIILKNSEEQCITVLLINSLSLSFKHTYVLGCHAGLASANLLP